MVLPIAFLIGFVFGWWRASARRGNRLDKLQYGGVHGIALMIIALFATIILDRVGIVQP